MVIVGAKGLAKEVLEIFAQQNRLENLYFFDDISTDLPDTVFDKFPIIRSVEEAAEIFRTTNDPSFVLGLGNPLLRYKMSRLISAVGGVLTSAISPKAAIGHFGNTIAPGCTILSGAVITNGVTLGEGCLVNPHCSVSHDAAIGNFVEMSPGARVTGHGKVGDFCSLGTNAVVLPKIKIGKNVMLGAGAVVTKDAEDNTLLVGVPAKEIKKLPPLNFA